MRPLRYLVKCQRCGQPARLKIASRWTDGHIIEWKTYALACRDCAEAALADARARRDACRTDPGETIDPPVILEPPGFSLGGAADAKGPGRNGGRPSR
jgi:hypothetical protein